MGGGCLGAGVPAGWADMATIPLGASIACNGCCMTVVEKGASWLAFEASGETLSKTTLELQKSQYTASLASARATIAQAEAQLLEQMHRRNLHAAVLCLPDLQDEASALVKAAPDSTSETDSTAPVIPRDSPSVREVKTTDVILSAPR